MSHRGRFGKYGEIKRFERLRKIWEPKGLLKKEGFGVRPFKNLSLPIVIEDGKKEDQSFIKELSQALFSEYGEYGSFLPSFLERKEARVWTASHGKSKVGFIIVAPYEELSETFEVVAVALAPRYQGRGIGKLLLDVALKFMKDSNLENVVAHVAQGNNASFNLFISKGFLPVSIKKRFYKSQDAVMFVKKIKTKGENHEESNR